ncbi:MAG: ZIP family metal transporter, partial [Pseudomonadota bacterium]
MIERPRALRLWSGLAIVLCGAAVLAGQFWQFVKSDPVVLSAFIGGSVAALAT